jgi:hypothetical protein
MTWTLEGGFQPSGPAGGSPRSGYPDVPGGGELPGFAPSAFDGATRPQRARESAAPPPPPPGLPDWFGQDDESDDSIQPLRYPEPQDEQESEAEPSPDTDHEERTLSEAEISRVATRVRAGISTPRLDPQDPALLDALARGLYGRLRSSLRSELISDRERSGILTEFN